LNQQKKKKKADRRVGEFLLFIILTLAFNLLDRSGWFLRSGDLRVVKKKKKKAD